MSMTTIAAHPYIDALLRSSAEVAKTPLTWLNERRAQALERANALTVPSTRDEEWRFTDITPLTRTRFKPAAAGARPAQSDVAPFFVPEARARLVFVDGVYAPELSSPASGEVKVAPLAQALGQNAAIAEPHLARLVDCEHDVFAALNTAHLRDGAYIVASAGATAGAPVHVLFVSTQADTVAYPRCLVVVQNNAHCMLIEDYVSLTDAACFTNAVTEIVLAPEANLQHVRLQRECAKSFHIANCAVAVGKDAAYKSQSVTLGARISRYDLRAVQAGEGAAITMEGLALISDRQLADTHTTIDHAYGHGRSRQLHKTIVDGAAHAVFNGKVVVRHGAQLTDSAQESRNLLLSDKARVDTKPQLEIFADDVKCSHGATVGQLEADQLFYLQSRGLSAALARSLLTYAFGAQVINRLPVASLVQRLEQAVLERAGG
jgi:Fe-S cluster assembly protein SufD